MTTLSERREPVLRVYRARDDIAAADDWGYFGPGSVIWRVNQEAAVGLGLGRALLLQLAHPFVAQAVADHSTFPDEAEERLAATWIAASHLVFGSCALADGVSARIRAIHARVHGSMAEDVGRWRRGVVYTAEDPDALLWVLITLAETSLLLYQHFIRPLSCQEQASYLADAERLGVMMDVRTGRLPRSLAGLQLFIEERIADGTACVGQQALALARACLNPPLNDLPEPLRRLYRSLQRTICHGLLPAELRRQYQPVLDERPNMADRMLESTLRAAVRYLPPRVRCDPLAWAAIQRWR